MNKEIIYQGNTIISVETLPEYSQPVIIKKPSKHHLSQQNIRSLEKEYEITLSLNKIKGVREALEQRTIENQPVLILEHIDGETLHDHIVRKTLDLRSKLEIAIDLANILGKIHQQDVIHLDLNSKNILIGNKHQTVHLIDLGSASLIDQSGHQKIRPDQILGNLPYISPEQTGRINRAVDERSDLYSLGVVLYELMTQQLPFDSNDPLELVHNHIAKKPISPSAVLPEIPEVISAIILKLLNKSAENRYQSSAGLQVDLEKCLQHLSPEDTIEKFPLGESDYARSLRFPQKLYGRDNELKELVSTFESVCQDTSSIVFVGGYPGIGKTALVEEIQRPVSEKSGYFIGGKFDQLATIPYAGITQAFAQFVSQILTQTETQLAAWRSKILEEVGPNGEVLMDVVPSLELVIGPQPAVPDLSGQEAQNRFNYVFQRFFGAIARSEHPICFFLDDLQWIDPASLGLLKVLFSSPDLAHLLVVGAYRDNEVDEAHPLMMLIADLEKAGTNLKRMTLQKLSEADVDALISDTLRRDPGEVRELSRLVYSQTDGNPFFTRQVLRSIEDQGLIALNTAAGSWSWDMDTIRDLDVVDSVVELLVGKLKELPIDIQETLKVAACIGNQFDIATLTVVTEGENETILGHIQEAVAAGLIWERDDRGLFVHDRVQEAAYTLVPPEDRDRTHLTIGRLLLADTDLEERIFDIANHYNLGSNLLTDPAERLELVRLNLAAGRKARVTAAFGASAAYLKQGLTLLDEGAWRDHYGLTLDVFSALIEVCYLNIQYEEVEALFDAITENAKQDVDASAGYKALITSCIARHQLGRAISLAESYLERLGVPLENERESDLTIAELYELPQMENREKLAAMEILMAMATPVLFSEPERLPSVFYTMLNLIRWYGNNSISAYAYAGYAYCLCLMQRYQEGNRFGQMVVDLLEKYPDPGRAAGIMNTLYTNVWHWRQPVHDQITPLKTCHRMAMQAGDFEYGLYSLLNYTFLLWGSGKLLEHCLAEFELTISLSESKNQQTSLQAALMLAQLTLNLTGRSPSTTQLEGKWFSEETMMSRLEGNHYLLALYGLLKMMLCYLFGDPGAAYRQTQDVLKYRGSLNPNYLYTKIPFYGALSCIAGIPDGESDSDRQERIERLATFENELELWADVAPMNYQHQYDLVMAEKYRISDKQWEAVQLYEQAIRRAQENQFVHDQALANELFAQFWQEQGNNRIAEMYMREARALYHQWGAAAKVTHLEDSYPRWFKTETAPEEQTDTTGKIFTTITQPITPTQLDMESIISASQLLAAETDLEQLGIKMMALVMSNSGADKALILLRREKDWFAHALGDSTAEKPYVLLNRPFDPSDSGNDLIPGSVFNYCHRSKEILVVGDVQSDFRFGKDRKIQADKIKSLTCVPVLSHGEIRALLYLENRQVADVFTLEKVEILKHLAAQFSVSMENALLYDSLTQAELKYRTVADFAYDWEYWANMDGTFNYVSPSSESITGYSVQEFMDDASLLRKIVVPEDLRIWDQHFHDSRKELQATEVIFRIHSRDGEIHWIEHACQPVTDNTGRSIGFRASNRDITERKLAEIAQQQSERNLAEAQQLAHIGNWWWDIVSDETHWSTELYQIFGVDQQNVKSSKNAFLERVHSDDKPVLEKNIATILSEQKPFAIDHRIVKPDGSIRYVHSMVRLESDAEKKQVNLYGIMQDITERKRAEEEVCLQREALARMDRTTSMGQLTGSIAHELNQPLTGILSNAQAVELLIKSGQWDISELAEIMSEIVSDSKRAGDVIRNLRAMYSEQKVEFSPIDINAIVGETTQLLHSEFVIQEIELTIDYASSLPKVDGNRIQIQQVLINLITNGIQAMSGKAEADCRLHIATTIEENEVKVWVEDCGPGIDLDKIDRIFEPLVTWKPGGTGMGLAINNAIIEAHGGQMWAENKPEGGARVGFTLPTKKERKKRKKSSR